MSSLLEESYSAPPVSITGSQSSPPPIQSYQLRQSVCEVETELLIQTFDDRILVIVTQNGKVGCLTQASLPQQIPLPPPTIPLQNGARDEDSSEEEALVESERERYAGIMDMVSQWPGPE
ncbi:hypothetical protein IAS59_004783 [Cryptococcus gattii]